MIKQFYRPFTALATRFRNSFSEDPFVRARAWTAILYFAFAFATLFVVGLIVDDAVAKVVEESLATGASADAITVRLEEVRLLARVANVVIIAIGAYVLLGVTLRPIKESADFHRRFVANISHELRTPLTVMKTETEVALRSRDLTVGEARVALESNLSRVDHISRVVQFLLAMSDFNAERSRALDRSVELDAVVGMALEHLSDMAAEKRIKLVSEFSQTETLLKGNSTALEKMATNLIKNAIAHTPAGGSVLVSIARPAGRLTLSVSDTGSGIPPEDLSHIFEPFFRASNAVPGGTGLGLSIVREVARLHKASIRAESEVGKGTCFIITFSG